MKGVLIVEFLNFSSQTKWDNFWRSYLELFIPLQIDNNFWKTFYQVFNISQSKAIGVLKVNLMEKLVFLMGEF